MTAARFAAIVSLVVCALAPALAAGTNHGKVAISTVTIAADRITIVVPVRVMGGDDELVARWRAGIDRAWNEGNDGREFAFCGRRIRFDAKFSRQTAGPAPIDSHIVYVEDGRPGEPFISRVWHAIGTAPTYSARTGFWARSMSEVTAAHEFGHLLGLLDEYVRTASGDGREDFTEAPRPDVDRHPDAWLSLMASQRGIILERHIRDVLRIHGVAELLECARAEPQVR